MPHFYAPPERRTGNSIFLKGEEAHHLCRVFRKREGEEIFIVDGCGNEFRCVIERCSQSTARVRVLSTRRKPKDPVVRVTLACGIPRTDRMSSLVEKATEIGVHRIVPLVTERSTVTEVSQERLKRWRRISVSAIKQCERSLLPEIDGSKSLMEFEGELGSYSWGIVGWESSTRRIEEALYPEEPINDVVIVVGPEGGLTEEEVEGLRKRGIQDVWLGQRKLRTETAAVVLLSLVLNHYGDL